MSKIKNENKSFKILATFIMGLVLFCLGIVTLGYGLNGTAVAEGENSLIYVGRGSTTNITGGRVGSFTSGNSVYIADGGTLNLSGGTINGNVYNKGTLNYSSGILTSVTLASGKYITFKANPTSNISITLDNATVGTTVGVLSGISSITLTRLVVTNLPANTVLNLVNDSIKITSLATQTYTVTIIANPSSYGSVNYREVLNVPQGTVIKTGTYSSRSLTVHTTNVVATPATSTSNYTYSFTNWTCDGKTISSTSGVTVTKNLTIYANFTRSLRKYTVRLLSNIDKSTNTYLGGFSEINPEEFAQMEKEGVDWWNNVNSDYYVSGVEVGTEIIVDNNKIIIGNTTIYGFLYEETGWYSFNDWYLLDESSGDQNIINGSIVVDSDLVITAFTHNPTLDEYYNPNIESVGTMYDKSMNGMLMVGVNENYTLTYTDYLTIIVMYDFLFAEEGSIDVNGYFNEQFQIYLGMSFEELRSFEEEKYRIIQFSIYDEEDPAYITSLMNMGYIDLYFSSSLLTAASNTELMAYYSALVEMQGYTGIEEYFGSELSEISLEDMIFYYEDIINTGFNLSGSQLGNILNSPKINEYNYQTNITNSSAEYCLITNFEFTTIGIENYVVETGKDTLTIGVMEREADFMFGQLMSELLRDTLSNYYINNIELITFNGTNEDFLQLLQSGDFDIVIYRCSKYDIILDPNSPILNGMKIYSLDYMATQSDFIEEFGMIQSELNNLYPAMQFDIYNYILTSDAMVEGIDSILGLPPDLAMGEGLWTMHTLLAYICSCVQGYSQVYYQYYLNYFYVNYYESILGNVYFT